jgi:hypothetical protein
MSRQQQRRVTGKRKHKVGQVKHKVGQVTRATTIGILQDDSVVFYWIVVPEGMTNEQAAETQEWHGPFRTEAEAEEDQRVTLFGPQSEIREGGMWDPAWDKPQ